MIPLGLVPTARPLMEFAPFTVPGDISTPNPVYFQRAEDMIRLTARHGMTVIFDPIETIGWLNTLKANSVEKGVDIWPIPRQPL
jgi:hypothetical protein